MPTLTITRDLRIDGAANDFSYINWLLIARDGTIAVPQDQSFQVRFFDAAGKPLGAFGRKGSGPGEDLGVGAAGWNGDTLRVLDPDNARWLFIHPDRKTSHTIPWRVTLTHPDDMPAGITLDLAVAFHRDGSRIYLARVFPNATTSLPAWVPKEFTTRDQLYLLVSPQGRMTRMAGWQHNPDCDNVLPQACQGWPYGVSADGSRLVTTAITRQTATTITSRVTASGDQGDTIFSREYTHPKVAVANRWADSVIRRWDSLSRATAGGRSIPTRNWTVPPFFPPIRRVIAGTDGSTWIEVPMATGYEWHVLDPRGDAIGRVMLPANVRLETAVAGTIWATERDADDVQSVVRYKVSH